MKLPRLRQTCESCGAKAPAEAQYCPKCGSTMAGGVRICGSCGTENKGNANFCRKCGQAMDVSAAPEMAGSRWLRPESDFAVRIEKDDLTHWLRRQIKIEPGVQALYIEGGAVMATVAPGTYTIDTLPGRIKEWITGDVSEQVTVLLVNTVPTDLEFNLGGIFTNDPLRIGLTIRLQAEVDEPGKFLINLLRGRERYTIENLREYLYLEVVQIAELWVQQHSAMELAQDFSLRAELDLALDEALKQTFDQTGLRFLQVRAMQFNLEHIDRITGKVSKARLMDDELAADLLVAEAEMKAEIEKATLAGEHQAKLDEIQHAFELRKAEAELQAKKDYAKLDQEYDLIELAKETHEVELEEKRVELHVRLRQAMMSDRIDEVESTAEFEAFLDDVDREKLMREKERADMIRLWEEEAQDQEIARAQVLAMTEVEHQYELHSAQLKAQVDLEGKVVDHEIDIARKKADWEFEMVRRNTDEELRLERERMRIAQEKAQTQADIERIKRQMEREEDREDALLGMELLAKMKEIRRLDKEENLRIERVNELELAKGKQELELEKMEAEERQRQAERDHKLAMQAQANEFELSRIEKIQGFGTAGAIILANPEQARMIKELGETEAMTGMSPEAIMARVSERSPEAAKAFAEIQANKDQSHKEETEKLYEQLMNSLQDQVRLMEEQQRMQMERERERDRMTKDMYDKGMDTVSQTARDVAQASQRDNIHQIFNTSGGTSGQVHPPNDGSTTTPPEETKTCPQCGKKVGASAQFCIHCGFDFPGM